MAKKETPNPWESFSEEALLDQLPDPEEQEEEVEEQEEETEEVDEKEKSKSKKPKASKKKEKEVEVDEEESEEEEEPEPKKKEKKKVKAESEEETEEESEDSEEETDSEEGAIDADAFFEEVNKLTGQEIEVDYGDTDPLTPQGVAIREQAVREAALDSFLEEVKENYPKAYQVLKHAYNGGNVADLFSQTIAKDYSAIQIGEKDEALAKEILKDYYKSKGVKSEARIAKLIETDEDSESGLIKEAQTALAEMQAEQSSRTDKIAQEQEEKRRADEKRSAVLMSAIDDVLKEKKLGNFKILDKSEVLAFRKYVTQNIRRIPNGNFEIATPIDQANLESALAYQFFQFKKGDLSKIVQQKAATENAKKLKLRLQAEQGKSKKTGDENKNRPKYATMKDFETDEE